MKPASQTLCVHGQGDISLFTGSDFAVKLDRCASSRSTDFFNNEVLVSRVLHNKDVSDLTVFPVLAELEFVTVHRNLRFGERR